MGICWGKHWTKDEGMVGGRLRADEPYMGWMTGSRDRGSSRRGTSEKSRALRLSAAETLSSTEDSAVLLLVPPTTPIASVV
jgi:hypothetical protein